MARAQPPDNQTSADGVRQILCPICHRPNLPRARFCQHCGRDVVLNNDGPVYRITRIIKEGGQGAVYEVVNDEGQRYAVKEMVERVIDPRELNAAVARFESEANLLQHLSHPRIPNVYDHFKDDGRSYLVMDFVRGEDLEELLKREGALPEARVLEIADQICDVLGYLHDNDLIYRDMKPSNVMVEPEGGVKLVDFGIANAFEHTDRGKQIGTPGYAPPEQYQGVTSAESDIYALGATLHHMLTGRDPRDEVPFSFPPVQTLAPTVSKRTADAVARALQMRPEDRFHSLTEMRAALRPLSAQTRQVRRAAESQAVPARSQPAPAVSAQTAPQQREPARPRQGGFFAAVGRFIRSLLVNLILLAVLAVGLALAGWYFVPDIAQPILRSYLPGVVVNLLPDAQPAESQLLTSQRFEPTVEVQVPAGSDMQAIRDALVAGYELAVTTTYGDGTRVNSTVPVVPVGEPELIATNDDGSQIYRAQMSGWVQRPANS